MGEVVATDGRRRHHGVAFRQMQPDGVRRVQHPKQFALFRVIRTGRIARRGANAAISLSDQGFVVQCFVRRIAP